MGLEGWRWLAVAVLLSSAPASAGGSESEAMTPVDLTIRNESAEVLRCTALLAHFMSEDLGRLAPGASLTVALRHDRASGALALAPREGRDVPLENLLCGRDSDWTQSTGEMPLTAARSGAAERFAARCGLAEGRVKCRVEPVP
jgi:hypothetical protein